MTTQQEALSQWSEQLIQYKLPRWEDLPDIDLYMDQVVSLIEKYVFLLPQTKSDKIITSAMVNNYVKLNLMPKPIKKRYQREHLAYLIVITILKQVLTIAEIKEGILLQSKINGSKSAYDLFCTEQEKALKMIAYKARLEINTTYWCEETTSNNLAIKMATTAFASKLLTQKIIELKRVSNQSLLQP